ATCAAYSERDSCPAHGAPQRPSSASTHGLPFASAAGMRWVQVRNPTAPASVCAASCALVREENGPSDCSRGRRTTDNRGNGSSVSTIHHCLPGLRERRLYS